MNAIEVENIIRNKLGLLTESIAFCYGKEYKEIIKEKISKMEFYVFSNNESQHDRLKYVEIFDIAKQFSKDISLELNVTESVREKIEKSLSIIIKEAAELSDDKVNDFIKEKIKEITELSDNIEDNIDKIKKVINYYKNDYEIKEIKETLSKPRTNYELYHNAIISSKKSVLRTYFYIYVKDEQKTEEVWTLLQSFNPDLLNIDLTESEKEKMLKFQIKFYNILGYPGDNLEKILKDIKSQNGIIVTSQVYEHCMSMYKRLNNDCLNDYIGRSSLPRIFDDLSKKKYFYNKEILLEQLFNPDILGLNVGYEDENENPNSFIIYINDSDMYSNISTNNVIHEIIHYLGGINSKYKKRGLSYLNINDSYLFEEAYVIYLSEKISNEYEDKYGSIIAPSINTSLSHYLECVKPYMEVVFKKYQKQLIYIHNSSDISFCEAKKIIPYQQILNSIIKIYNAGEEDRKNVIEKEIRKLSRSNVK